MQKSPDDAVILLAAGCMVNVPLYRERSSELECLAWQAPGIDVSLPTWPNCVVARPEGRLFEDADGDGWGGAVYSNASVNEYATNDLDCDDLDPYAGARDRGACAQDFAPDWFLLRSDPAGEWLLMGRSFEQAEAATTCAAWGGRLGGVQPDSVEPFIDELTEPVWTSDLVEDVDDWCPGTPPIDALVPAVLLDDAALQDANVARLAFVPSESCFTYVSTLSAEGLICFREAR